VSASYTYFADGDVLLAKVTPCFENGKAGIARSLRNGVGFGSSEFYVLRPGDKVLAEWIYRCVMHDAFRAKAIPQMTGTGGLQRVPRAFVEGFDIPLPPLEVQREIVSEIDAYQRVIDGARAVLDNYQPRIPVDPDWPVVSLAEIAEFKNGLNFTKSDNGEPLRIVGVSDFQSNTLVPSESLASIQLDAPVGQDYLLQPGDILFVRSNGNPDLVGRSMLAGDDIGYATFSGFTIRARCNSEKANPRYLAHFFKTPAFAERMKKTGRGANIRNLSQGILAELPVPLPDLESQNAIVAEIETEQALVYGNRDLIARFENKIDNAMAGVWGDAKAEEVA
jgi:type I restriction enzyme M protein